MSEDEAIALVCMPFGLWLFINLVMLLSGMCYAEDDRTCGKPMRRIEYIFPGYEAGCWLGAIPK